MNSETYPIRLTPQSGVQFPFQSFDDLLANTCHLAIGEGAVGCLVGDAVGQALLSCSYLPTAKDIEQSHRTDQRATRLSDQSATVPAAMDSSTTRARSSSTGGKPGTPLVSNLAGTSGSRVCRSNSAQMTAAVLRSNRSCTNGCSSPNIPKAGFAGEDRGALAGVEDGAFLAQ